MAIDLAGPSFGTSLLNTYGALQKQHLAEKQAAADQAFRQAQLGLEQQQFDAEQKQNAPVNLHAFISGLGGDASGIPENALVPQKFIPQALSYYQGNIKVKLPPNMAAAFGYDPNELVPLSLANSLALAYQRTGGGANSFANATSTTLQIPSKIDLNASLAGLHNAQAATENATRPGQVGKLNAEIGDLNATAGLHQAQAATENATRGGKVQLQQAQLAKLNADTKKTVQDIAQSADHWRTLDQAKQLLAAGGVDLSQIDLHPYQDANHGGMIDMSQLNADLEASATTGGKIAGTAKTNAEAQRIMALLPGEVNVQQARYDLLQSQKTGADLDNELKSLEVDQSRADMVAAHKLWGALNLPGIPPDSITTGDAIKLAQELKDLGGAKVTLGQLAEAAGVDTSGWPSGLAAQTFTANSPSDITSAIKDFVDQDTQAKLHQAETENYQALALLHRNQALAALQKKNGLTDSDVILRVRDAYHANYPYGPLMPGDPDFVTYMQTQGPRIIATAKSITSGTPAPAATPAASTSTGSVTRPLPPAPAVTWNGMAIDQALAGDNGDVAKTLANLEKYKPQMPAATYNAWKNWLLAVQKIKASR